MLGSYFAAKARHFKQIVLIIHFLLDTGFTELMQKCYENNFFKGGKVEG